MPGLEGRDICRWLRRNPATGQVPIILLTNRSGDEARAEAAQAGANGFIRRPAQLPEVRQRIEAILHVETVALSDDNRRLLEETCQAALTILPCNLAWMLIVEQGGLLSQALATDQGPSASAVFLHVAAENKPGPLSFPLEPGSNPLSEAALRAGPLVNIPVKQLQDLAGGKSLHRALGLLRLSYVHFLPLQTSGQVIGMLVLGSKETHDALSPRGQQILSALANQSAIVVNNARLVRDLAAREEQMKTEQAFRKMILDTMGDGLAVIDEQAMIRYVNNRLLRMSGYARQELFGVSVGVIFPPALRDHLTASLRRQSRATVSFSQQLFTKDGRTVPVLMSRATAVSTSDWSTVLVFTDLTEQRQREQALERQSAQLQTLNRAVQALTSALALDDVLMVFAQSAAEIVRSSDACLFLLDDRQPDRFKVAAAIGPQAEAVRGTVVPLASGIAGQVLRSRRPQLLSAAQFDERAMLPIERSSGALIAVPLIMSEQVKGVLEVFMFDADSGPFIQGDVEILENLTAAAAIAIENVRLLEETQHRVSELSTLLEASGAASSTLDIGSILELIARRLAQALNVSRCSIATWNRSANHLTMLAEVCNTAWSLDQGSPRPATASSLSIAAMKSGKISTVSINDPALHPQIRAQLEHFEMCSVVLIPLRLRVNGIVELYSPKDVQDFSPAIIQTIEDSVQRWREQLRKQNQEVWYSRDNVADLYKQVAQISEAVWCVVSAWDRREPVARTVQEIGFVLWREEAAVAYRLEDYPVMAQGLAQSDPITLHADALDHDPNERDLMRQSGARSGLIVPLLVRGEASGLVKLLDTTPDRVFNIAELSLCQGIANVLGSAIENARLYHSLAKRANTLQAAYDEVRQADRLKDDLIQNLSHELQTPLHQIMMQLDLLANDAFGSVNQEQKEQMRVMMDKITQLADLIRDMLSMQKLETQRLEFAAAQIEDIVTSAVRNQQPLAIQAGLQLAPSVAPQVSGVWVDAPRIVQVIEQLIENAIKFSPRTERKANQIEVRVAETSGAMIRVSVQDYGIGIAPDEFENIFQRGYQVDSSMTRRFGGAGLGLSLARQIVEAHGGKIWVESTLGAGSQFHFTIPKTGVKFHQQPVGRQHGDL